MFGRIGEEEKCQIRFFFILLLERSLWVLEFLRRFLFLLRQQEWEGEAQALEHFLSSQAKGKLSHILVSMFLSHFQAKPSKSYTSQH